MGAGFKCFHRPTDSARTGAHDRFIDRAKAGGINIVFFGSTETEMWLWQDRGRSSWEQTLAPLKAEDFGSQGTRFASLLWRMQNGELDGYQAKLVVLQAEGVGFAGDTATRDDRFEDYVSKYAAIIAEVRTRQPQAKILFFGVFPRYQTHAAPAAENAALAKLGNNESVFFIDMRDHFFRPDGSFDTRLWNSGGGTLECKRELSKFGPKLCNRGLSASFVDAGQWPNVLAQLPAAKPV
jgi:hypothetical protein